MRVLQLTWEYPPRTIGGLARHVAGLSRALADEGVDVQVVTVDPESPGRMTAGRLEVIRAPGVHPQALNFLDSVHHLNFELLEAVLRATASGRRYDLVHAHDWLVAYSARAVKHALGLPLIATMHATEWGRHAGLHTPLQRHISDVEWWLCYEAWRVIACSEAMRDEVIGIFQLPSDKVAVLPNGIDRVELTSHAGGSAQEPHRNGAVPRLFFIGRLVREKGVHVLLDAVRLLYARGRPVQLVIAGEGPARPELEGQAAALGLGDAVSFTGFADDAMRRRLYRSADLAVFPSLYEPFGIVVLEAMAAGVPVVVSDVGGLREIVEHDQTGWRVRPGDAEALSEQIAAVLPPNARLRAVAARARDVVAERYAWPAIARRTRLLYERVLQADRGRRRGTEAPRSPVAAVPRGGVPGRYEP